MSKSKGGWRCGDTIFQAGEDMVIDGRLNEKMIPRKIVGNFYCNDLGLTSLEGCPIEVTGDFDCQANYLTSLVGSPKNVGGYFECTRNDLTSLYGISKIENQAVFASNNKYYLDVEIFYIQQKVISDDYWSGLLHCMIEFGMPLNEIKTWPKNFLNSRIEKSVEGIVKFKL